MTVTNSSKHKPDAHQAVARHSGIAITLPAWAAAVFILGTLTVTSWGLILIRPGPAHPEDSVHLIAAGPRAGSRPAPRPHVSGPITTPRPFSATLASVPPWSGSAETPRPIDPTPPTPPGPHPGTQPDDPHEPDAAGGLAGIHATFCRRAETDPEAGLRDALRDWSGDELVAALSGLFAQWVDRSPAGAAAQVERIPAGPARDAALAEIVAYSRDLDPAAAWAWLCLGSRELILSLGPTVLERWDRIAPGAARSSVVALSLPAAEADALLSFVTETEAAHDQKE